MCDTLVELKEAMGRYAASFDPSLLGGTDAGAVMGLAGAIEAMAATVKGLAAARVSDCGAWKAGGDRSAAHHLARTTGTSVGRAGEAIETARRLARLPGLAAAARAGALSAQQAAAIAGACGADPGAQSRLIEKARNSSLAELRDECARTRAAADPDPEARRKWLYPACAVEGCASVAFLKQHHRVDWAASHTTVLDLLDRLCSHHHDLKTIANWALVAGRGKRAFVPVEDPRHPRHCRAGSAGAHAAGWDAPGAQLAESRPR